VFSATRFRTYGAASMGLIQSENPRGCPAAYKEKYIDNGGRETGRRSFALEYGSMIHRTLEVMERDMIAPEDALARAWSPGLPTEAFAEAVSDLNAYLERGGPMTRFGTIDTEIDLTAMLYEDEDFGPVYYRAILDWIGVDLESPTVLHVIDYKTNRASPKREDLEGDMQLKGQTWLVREHWKKWMPNDRPMVVTHLDAIKYRDVETMYTSHEIDEWQAWASAVARAILRDTTWNESLNEGCSWCFRRTRCGVIAALPGRADQILAEREGDGKTLDEQWAWVQQAQMAVKTLKAGIDDTVSRLEEAVLQYGGEVRFGDQQWKLDTARRNDVDLPRLHEIMGNRFYDVVKTSKAAIEREARRVDPSTGSQMLACVDAVPDGTTIRKGKAPRERPVR
jgi:hypothetical protein